VPESLAGVGILRQRVSDHENGKADVPVKVDVRRTLQPADQALARERERQDPQDQHQRREQISARYHEQGRRAEDGELGEQQNGRDRLAQQQRRCIGRREGGDVAGLDTRERPGSGEKCDQHGDHNGGG
jgi:hypothetical protein